VNLPRSTLFVLTFVAIASLLLSSCSGADSPDTAPADLAAETQTVAVPGGGSYTDVSSDGLAAMLETKDFPLINVHIPYEGHLEDTDAYIPYNEIGQHLDQLPADEDARIVLYCRSGSMSATAARELVGLGYTDVWNLDGGFIGWRNSGRTVLTDGG
jgi:rhodanese-related sulfurtransferase